MSVEENKALADRFCEEMWNKKNLSIIDELLAPDFVIHGFPPGVPTDKEGYKQWIGMLCAAFPDVQCTNEDLIAEGDKVVARWTWTGTHKGEFMGIAPTGKKVSITGIVIQRIEGGKVVEEWLEEDTLGMMKQLGLIPPPGQGK